MRTFTEPPLHTWTAAKPAHADRQPLLDRINHHAARLGTARLPHADPPLIATGHQASLWHPGILAKDLAMRVACDRLGAAPLHLVVDQDAHAALTLDLPREQGDQLKVRTLRLAPTLLDVPIGAQPPADPAVVLQALREADDPRLEALIAAFTDLPDTRTLAEQMAVVLVRLMQPYTGNLPVLMVSDLAALPDYQALMEAMLRDARRCVGTYNRAVAHHPAAGIAPLIEERDRVELPLWAVTWKRPRRRVYADLADREPIFTDEAGDPIDADRATLLPRALLLTAVMRSRFCDRFIHGHGGGVYDRITDDWWQAWRSEPLAPRSVVSADLFLDFDAPVADRGEVAEAVWFRHHVPHNVDRLLHLDGPRVREKWSLIGSMDADRDRRRRRRAFKVIHQINGDLLGRHPDLLADADRRLARARQGIENAAIARRRDWCFAFYPPESLHALKHALAREAAESTAFSVQSGHAEKPA